MSKLSVRRDRIREMTRRAIPLVKDPQRFTTHEVWGLIQAMTQDDLRGIPFAQAIIRRVGNPMAFSMYLKGDPTIAKHKDGVVNIAKFGEGRVRSGLWRIR